MKHYYFKHLFTALLLLCTTVATAHDFEVDGIYYNITDATNKTVEVTYRGGYSYEYSDEYTGNIVIPESVACDGNIYSVTSIGYEAFAYCRGLTSVEIGNSVTSIGEMAFWSCDGLASIVVDGNNTTYDSRENCNAIIETETNTLILGCNNTVIPNSVTSIGYGAFDGCKGLTSIEIPNSVTSIGEEAFSCCTGLTSIEIPNSVTSIGDLAFYGTAWYNNLPDGVVYAGRVLYEYKGTMPANTSIVIKEGTVSISDYAFLSCYGLTSIEIPNSVTSIGYNAFLSCSGLTNVVIPNSVTSIGHSAFRGCTSLTSVEIPNSVTSIGMGAFYGCSSLTSITSLIPAENLFTTTYVFNSVDKNACTLYVPYGAKETYASTEGWSKFANIVELEKPITEVTITINQYGNATYCSEYALDFSSVDGLKAYAATGYNKVTQVVTLTRVQTAQEGTGLFLMAEPGEYTVPVIEYSNDYTLNLLVGTLEQTVVNSTEGAMSNYKFTILPGDETPMFYPFEDGTTLSAGKAYLQIPTAWLPATAQKSLSIRFDYGTTTDIDEVKGESGEVKTVYDLQGRIVENPSTGIYIIDGKKVLIK